MSDGNFNRQLLPKTELSSGLRAGKAQMRAKAEKAFDEVINKYFPEEILRKCFPEESQSKKVEIKSYFMEMLRN